MLRIFIGFDPREAVAFNVLQYSILQRASKPTAVIPLALNQLGDEMWRERNPLQSTDFSFSRFLTPYLSGFEGWSLFIDCDMLVLDDVAKLFALADDEYAVQVIKHDHRPAEDVKFLGAVQTKYEKKNWSSVMLFNNAKCKALTPEYVNTASGLELHQFKWLGDDNLIGELPHRWGQSGRLRPRASRRPAVVDPLHHRRPLFRRLPRLWLCRSVERRKGRHVGLRPARQIRPPLKRF